LTQSGLSREADRNQGRHALVATLVGSSLAQWLHRETGPIIVTVSAAGFVLTLFWQRF
jgi:hypothetical protein